jgi:hypothetical protein
VNNWQPIETLIRWTVSLRNLPGAIYRLVRL